MSTIIRDPNKIPITIEPKGLYYQERFKNINPEIYCDKYEDLRLCPIYSISTHGRIFNSYIGQFEELFINYRGYSRVNLWFINKNGEIKIIERAVDELVMLTFNYISYKEDYWIKHLNSDTTDNSLDNLRWIDKTTIKYKKKKYYVKPWRNY